MKKMTRCTLRCGLYIVLICCIWPFTLWAVENSECFDCHSDESLTKESTSNILQVEITESLYVDEEKFNHSIHNLNDITCVDCHSDIEELNYDEEVPHAIYLQAVVCASCHEESGEEFKSSVHMEMRNKGITMTCYACHGYHYVHQIEGASVAERTNSVCLKCHNPYQYHEWLPAGDSHFAFVECVVCHAPDVPRHINLRFFDLVTNKFYNGDDLLKILGIDYDEFMPTFDKNKDEIINSGEFDDLVLMLKHKKIRTIFHAELVADVDSIAHQIHRGSAQKTCGNCHAADSPYFNAVSILLTMDDGTVERYNVERSVLESYHVNHFYLLGGTRIKLLDKLGLLIIVGGVCGAFGHLSVRLLTRPIRRRREENDK